MKKKSKRINLHNSANSPKGLYEKLEERVLFDAVPDGSMGMLEGADQNVHQPLEGDVDQVAINSAIDQAEQHEAQSRNEVVFVDKSVENHELLVADLVISNNAEVIFLDQNSDGLEQIAAVLEGRENIDAIHMISHGSQGELHLGNDVLNADSMQGEHADELENIGRSLTDEGDILIYGCDFTSGEKGLEAAMILGGLTGADIASSDDITGHETRGGDWELETEVGDVEAQTLSSNDWKGTLAAPVATNNTGSVQEDTTLVDSGNVIKDNDGFGVDSDADGDPLGVTDVDGTTISGPTNIVGTYGTLIMDSAGEWTYNLNNSHPAVQALNTGNSLQDVFTYTLSEQAEFATNGSLEGAPATVNRNVHNSQVPPNWTILAGVTPDIFNATTTFGGYAWLASPDGGDFLHGIGQPGWNEGFSQTLTGLTVGQQYTVTFSQSISDSTWATTGNSGHWNVTVGGTNFDSASMTTPAPGVTVPWQQQSFTFTAGNTSETITFTATEENGARVDLGIDGISIASTAASAASDTANLTVTINGLNEPNTPPVVDLNGSSQTSAIIDIDKTAFLATLTEDPASTVIDTGGVTNPFNARGTCCCYESSCCLPNWKRQRSVLHLHDSGCERHQRHFNSHTCRRSRQHWSGESRAYCFTGWSHWNRYLGSRHWSWIHKDS